MKLVLIYIVIPILWMLIIGWFTGSKAFFFGPKDDERKQSIKQKTIIQSWATLFLFLLTNFLFDLFDLRDARLDQVEFVYPELLYLLILVLSYVVFYWINTKKMSA
ncbi:hypothetical protein SAMN05421676_10389 [Salinibacillus kushneri]|uniref:Uncharacterized protein n=1 Tax=Salinibacillus kushneri TaxID=237682 RepID=A0A1I0C9Q7_9BACI|nr:hypothetical protein [Salinibacillus kushneri]SET16307.1 hypothetical protein SAMN05421676_10389 [Salinibacillus kushneri]